MDAQFNLIIGRNTGTSNAAFSLYKSDAAGNTVGSALAMQDISGQLTVGGLDPSGLYLLRMTGNLRADNPNTKKDESTRPFRYCASPSGLSHARHDRMSGKNSRYWPSESGPAPMSMPSPTR
ncbi:MAG: hypothetical protein EXQ93_00475 [Alphaproteobacteria bacterium]|nr:hypothetical protein [Alphaproteobacteria bacterium]